LERILVEFRLRKLKLGYELLLLTIP